MEIRTPQTKQFQRNIENFVCEECDHMVVGDGYSNHCPNCLVSKHVDVHPGDRAAECGGIMDVIDIFFNHGRLNFRHKCRECGHEKNNKAHKEDNIDAITSFMKNKGK